MLKIKTQKTILFALLLLVFLAVCGVVLALELNYPSLPGLGKLDENAINERGLGFFAMYLTRLAFFVTTGICLVVVVVGGVFYLSAGQKPAVVQQARDMMSRGFLGLFIIITSYLVLKTINPQLLTLQLSIEKITPLISEKEYASPQATVSFHAIDTTGIPKEIVAKMEKKVAVNSIGEIVPDNSPDKKETVMMIETPFLRIKQLLEQAQQETAKINELLAKCQCGMSIAHTKKEGVLNYQCKEGMDPEDKKQFLQEYNAKSPEPYSQEQAICLTQADNCGIKNERISGGALDGYIACDLREVQNINIDENGQPKTDKDGNPLNPEYWAETSPDKLEAVADLSNKEKDGLIKYHREKLLYLSGLLSPQKMKLSVEQMAILEHKLKASADNFLSINLEQGFFKSDFENFMAEQGEKGVAVQAEVPEQFAAPGRPVEENPPVFSFLLPKQNIFVSLINNTAAKLSALFFKPQFAKAQMASVNLGPATVFYPVAVENYQDLYFAWQDTLKRNEAVDEEARRANLFTVLAELSLEQIDKIFKECLASALGNADYNFSGNVKEIIRKAIQQGTADYVVLQMAQASAGFSGLVGKEITDEINSEADGHLKEKCAAFECGCTAPTNDGLAYISLQKKCSNGASFSDWLKLEPNGICVGKCVKENIPPHFISNQLAIIATEPLIKRLPDKIEEILTSKLKDVVLSPEFNTKLDSEMLDLYNDVLNSALSKSFVEQIPFLKKTLSTKIGDWVAKQAPTTTGQIHKLLSLQIQNLRPFINKQAEKLGKIIAVKAEDGIADGMAKLKEQMPTIFPENQTMAECQTYENLKKGYGYSARGKCVKLTPEEIMDKIGNGVTFDDQQGNAHFMTAKEICKGAGYCWGADWEIDNVWEGINKGEEKCGECQWLQFGKVADLATKEGWREIGKAGLRGAINYTEQFAVAITEMTMHTALAYVEVWLEDEIFQPLEPYLQQIIGLQDKLRGFLNSTVADILPAQLVGVLNSNVDTLLRDICAKGKPGSQTTINLYNQFSWGGKITLTTSKNDYTQDAIDKVCHFSKHLHTTLLNEIAVSGGAVGATIAQTLRTEIQDLLLCKGEATCKLKEYLNKSPAQIIFEQYGFPDIQKIIQGTPKQLLCGELAIMKEASGVWKTPAKECDNLSVKKDKLLASIPYIDQQKLDTFTSDPDNQKLFKLYCPFKWAACDNYGLSFDLGDLAKKRKIGDILALFIKQSCVREANHAQQHCQGKCLGNFSDNIDPVLNGDPNCPSATKDKCSVCNFLEKPAFETLVNGALITDPDIGYLFQRTAERKEKELAVYEWFLTYFPQMEVNIKNVADSRQITPVEWVQVKRKLRNLQQINSLSQASQGENLLKIMVSTCLNETKIADFLIKIPFGIVKPFEQGEAALLRKAGQGEEFNFLNHSPNELLSFYICGQVKQDFKAQYPEWTFEALKQRELGELGKALPYSMESLERPTIAKILEQILYSPISNEEKAPYLTCLSLELAPYQMFGLDQQLIYYLRPKEYQILFNLINDQLYDFERPQKLNEVLTYLYGKNPVMLLADAGEKANNSMALLAADLLATPLNDYLNNLKDDDGNLWFKQKIITTLAKKYPGFNDKISCSQLDPELLALLKKTPAEVLADGLNMALPGLSPPDSQNPCVPWSDNFTLMNCLAKLVPVFGEPYLDSFGKFTRLDQAAYNLFEKKQDFDAQANKWATKGQEAIQKATDKAFMEAPIDLAQFLGNRLASLWGGEEGDDLGKKIGGSGCWQVQGINECDSNKGYVFREKDGSKECCDLGKAAVCEPKCRLKQPEENCKANIGESAKEISGAAYCCFDDKCNQCRAIPADLKDYECKREGEQNNGPLCCKERDVKQAQGPLLSPSEDKLCCTTVIDCITRKFLDHLELLNDYVVNGPPPF